MSRTVSQTEDTIQNNVNTLAFAGNNTTAIVSPDATNDDTENYIVGSRWIDTVLKEEFTCMDNSTGAAVWKMVSEPPYMSLNQTGVVAMPTVTPNLFGAGVNYQFIFNENKDNGSARFTADTNTIKINTAGLYRIGADCNMDVGAQTANRNYRTGLQGSTTSAVAAFTNINSFAAMITEQTISGTATLYTAQEHYLNVTTVPFWIRSCIDLENPAWDTVTRNEFPSSTLSVKYMGL